MLILTLGLSGCGNQDNDILDLGSVSLGQQLIDLKQARTANAISEAEYQAAKSALLQKLTEDDDSDSDAEDSDSDADGSDDDSLTIEIRSGDDQDEEEDDDSGFIF